jgi:hypothetical protein
MDLEKEQQKFLEDLIEYVCRTSKEPRRTLENAHVPINGSFQKKYPETFRKYSKDEERIIDRLADREILKIKVHDREIHQSLDENKRSKRKELSRTLGVREDVIDELLEEIGEKL